MRPSPLPKTEYRLIILSGPSGVGKTEVIKRLKARLNGLIVTGVSYTTRPPRPGLVEDKQLHTVSPKQFDALIKQGKLLEWAWVHQHRYGTSRWHTVRLLRQRHVFLNLDVQGALNMKRMHPKSVLIFLAPERLSQLEQRIRTRVLLRGGELNQAELRHRLKDAKWELAQQRHYDQVVVNRHNQIGRTVAELAGIIRSLTLLRPASDGATEGRRNKAGQS